MHPSQIGVNNNNNNNSNNSSALNHPTSGNSNMTIMTTQQDILAGNFLSGLERELKLCQPVPQLVGVGRGILRRGNSFGRGSGVDLL